MTIDRYAPRPALRSSHRWRAAGVGLLRSLPAPSPVSSSLLRTTNAAFDNQYDDLARVPRAQTREGCRRRTIASRHRRHSSPRCSCRVVPPIRIARFVDLIRRSSSNTQAGARNGFGEPRDWGPKSTLSRPRPAAETTRPAFEPAKVPANWAIRQRPENAGSHRTAWWAREDSNLQPDRYERSALTLELRARREQAVVQEPANSRAFLNHIGNLCNRRRTRTAWQARSPFEPP
jgi:hypothetical protein